MTGHAPVLNRGLSLPPTAISKRKRVKSHLSHPGDENAFFCKEKQFLCSLAVRFPWNNGVFRVLASGTVSEFAIESRNIEDRSPQISPKTKEF
jgi:hypothetical protein